MKVAKYTTRMASGRLCRSRSGQSLVEFAMIAPLFFVLLFGIIDFGRLFFTQMTLQHALREAGRFAVTGRQLDDPDKPGQQLTRLDSIIRIAQQAAAGLDVNGIAITSLQGGANNPGGPGDTITVSLTTSLQLITPLIGRYFGPEGVYTFTVSTTFKNEPFPESSAN